MNKHTLAAVIVVIVGIMGIILVKLLIPLFQEQYAYGTSDAKDLKGEITIALDSWIGYFPLQSPVYRKLMRDEGYRINVVDDQANYPRRMEDLQKGKTDFAVCTIDSYLINGLDKAYPGTIVAVIDESKGGDAVVAWKDKIDNMDTLKTKTGIRIAFTPDSPSHHLLKALGVHFGIPFLLEARGSWRVETVGAEQAYRKLMGKDVEAAVIWEPHVTESLSNPGIIKLLGTEDTEKLVIDILLVNRAFSREKAEVVQIALAKYFETLKVYSDDPALLEEDIVRHTRMKAEKVKPMLAGVRWVGYRENTRWFGVDGGGTTYREELPSSIDSTVEILMETGDFDSNPLPNEDPYTLINSSFIETIYISGYTPDAAEADAENSLERKFPPLSEEQWEKLKVVGSLTLRHVTFRSGTSELDEWGELQIDQIVENVRHYPNFRIVIEGHTSSRGDEQANLALSRERADSVKGYMVHYYSIDPDRIRAAGMGGKKPLPQKDGESDRSYDDRLKRVEVYLVTGGAI